MAKLREWLDEEGFDWSTGVIIAHTVADGSYSPGWSNGGAEAFKFDFRENTLPDTKMNVLLDHEFDDGLGSPEAPMFIAQDKDKIYFPSKYDGATDINFIYKDIEKYMDVKNHTPYPGGG